MVVEYLGADEILSSGVGVREGVFLSDMLRNNRYKFPPNINASIRSIRDRFDILHLPEGNKRQIARNLFEALSGEFDSSSRNLKILLQAISLSNIGKMLTIYKSHQHAFYIASQELNFGFLHEEVLLISLLLRSRGDSLYYKPLYRRYKELLPDKKEIKWLCFIHTLALILHENSSQAKISFEWDGKLLRIKSNKSLYLASEEIASMERPKRDFLIELERVS
jgi:exopolyphosphatase/guanosine-5'-triphosphate,3'-diphosphate pyrophosphatase